MPVYPIKGVTTLSRLNIDVDKDWAAKGISNIKEVADSMATGDMFFQDGTKIIKFPPSSIGMQVVSGGPSHAPAWGYPDVGKLGWVITSGILVAEDDSVDVGGVFNNAGTECRAGNTGGSVLHTAMRFSNITIPAGALVYYARINFVCQFSRAGQTVPSRIYGEKSATPAQYGAAENFLLRTMTTNYVSWTPAASWTINQEYNSPELRTIVQELVDAYAPYANGQMAFQWRDNGAAANNFHSAHTFESAPGLAPVLIINWGYP